MSAGWVDALIRRSLVRPAPFATVFAAFVVFVSFVANIAAGLRICTMCLQPRPEPWPRYWRRPVTPQGASDGSAQPGSHSKDSPFRWRLEMPRMTPVHWPTLEQIFEVNFLRLGNLRSSIFDLQSRRT